MPRHNAKTSRPKAKPRAKAPVADTASQAFVDLLQMQMRADQMASLRDTRVNGEIVTYEFTNGTRIDVRRKDIDAIKDHAGLAQFVRDAIAARQPV